MSRASEAIQRLFGSKPVTEQPESTLGWTPAPEVMTVLIENGYPTMESFLTQVSKDLGSNPTYFEDIAASALRRRDIRERVQKKTL